MNSKKENVAETKMRPIFLFPSGGGLHCRLAAIGDDISAALARWQQLVMTFLPHLRAGSNVPEHFRCAPSPRTQLSSRLGCAASAVQEGALSSLTLRR